MVVHPLNDKVVEIVLVSEDGLHDVAGGLAPVDSAAHQGGVAVAAGHCTDIQYCLFNGFSLFFKWIDCVRKLDYPLAYVKTILLT